jgi:hypothetical protein
MEAKTPQPNELASKLKYVAPTILRATVEGVDYVFVPGQDYENLPANHFLLAFGNRVIWRLRRSAKAIKKRKLCQTKPLNKCLLFCMV